MPTPSSSTPISLTLNPRLDSALAEGWEAWDTAARAAGANAVAGWMAQRLARPDLRVDLLPHVEAYLLASEPDDRATAIAELAELVEGEDDPVADTLWEAMLALGVEQGDPDMIVEAITRLAAIAEDSGDPLAAAEYHIEFLNWRRQPGNASDPEAVADAFDEILRLADRDGDRQAVAMWEYRLAAFIRLQDADDPRAYTGDWERSPTAFESWA